MRLEVEAFAGRVGGEQDTQRILRRIGVEPALDLLTALAARQPVDDRNAIFGPVCSLNGLFKDRLQIAFRALPVFSED